MTTTGQTVRRQWTNTRSHTRARAFAGWRKRMETMRCSFSFCFFNTNVYTQRRSYSSSMAAILFSIEAKQEKVQWDRFNDFGINDRDEVKRQQTNTNTGEKQREKDHEHICHSGRAIGLILCYRGCPSAEAHRMASANIIPILEILVIWSHFFCYLGAY